MAKSWAGARCGAIPMATSGSWSLGVVTDGNRWLLLGLNRANEFHTIAEWTVLTDDPRLIAQRLWLLAKPALAQPTSALIEFLARRTLVEVLKENTKALTKKVNEKLPDGSVSEELIGRWLRDALTDMAGTPRLVTADAPPSPSPPPPTSPPDPTEQAGKRIGLSDLLGAGLLLPQDLLMVEGIDGKRQTATITPDAKINVAGQVFDSVSPAALRALELAGKVLKAVNGWTAFRVMRGGNYVGTLLQVRDQYEEREQEASTIGTPQDAGFPAPEGPDPAVLSAVDQMKPLLALLPELTVKTSKAMVSLYVGKLVVAYAYPRKTGVPRLKAYVGETCPEWAIPDTTHAAWCYIEDWSTNLERVTALLKKAPRRRAEDMTAGLDAYRRRPQPPNGTATLSAE